MNFQRFVAKGKVFTAWLCMMLVLLFSAYAAADKYRELISFPSGWFSFLLLGVYFAVCALLTAFAGFFYSVDGDYSRENYQGAIGFFALLAYPVLANLASQASIGVAPGWVPWLLFKSRIWLPGSLIGLWFGYYLVLAINSRLERYYVKKASERRYTISG